MATTEDLVVSLPLGTAVRLRAMARLRGPGSEGDIITEALASLLDQAEEDGRVATLVSAGFESKTWHELEDVRAALKKRYASL
jgi:hypothetical protein